AYQHSSGNTLNAGKIIAATTSIGDGVGAGSKQNQIGLGVGLIHRF
ncbi:MAG: porin, partial [Burkholderia sp.]|nr:porin [Burkholderia sp.]